MDFSSNLEGLKTNIIRWYQFKENSNILVIGEDIRELCNFLTEKNNVKSIDSNVGNISNQKFDYIIIKDNISYLKDLKKNLNEEGVILLLINNRWGVTYFAGNDGFETLYGNKNNLLSKEQIENKLFEYGYNNYTFFYPLPNYEYTNIIFSDKYLPNYNDSKLAYNNIYLNENYLVFNEVELLRSFTKNCDFTKFTNSYLIEINPKSSEKAIFYGNSRKEEYKLITKIYDEKVEKETYSKKSLLHLSIIKDNIEDLKLHSFNMLDTVEKERVISKYVNLPNMYHTAINNIKDGKIEKTIEMIQNLYYYIKEKFLADKVDILNQEYFENMDASKFFILKKGYIDLVFENMFIDDNQEIYIYDQEWVIDNCPLEFIIFRLINNMYIMNSEIEEYISREDMLNRFGLLCYFNEFLKAEEIFQNRIVNQDIIKIYNRANEFIISKEDIIKAKENSNLINLYKAENYKKERYIESLKAEIERLKKINN